MKTGIVGSRSTELYHNQLETKKLFVNMCRCLRKIK
jgi:hypothetical protein